MNISYPFRFFGVISLFSLSAIPASAQDVPTTPSAVEASIGHTKVNAELASKSREWVASLQLADAGKVARLEHVLYTHLMAVRDWHNTHPASTVPAGINPVTGQKLSELDRQIIADSAMPDSVHTQLMDGLRRDLNEGQVAQILDKYTIGKVDFTMKGYAAIVPDLTEKEKTEIRKLLEQAREQAVDYKSMKQISAIFENLQDQSRKLPEQQWTQLAPAVQDLCRRP